MKTLRSIFFRTSSDPNPGLLLLRIFIGLGILTHGAPKLMGGSETWSGLGAVMTGLGAPGPAVLWGFMAAFAEGVGGLMLIFGAATTLSSFLIVFTMSVAVLVVHAQDPFAKKELALLYLFGALLFLFKGAGRFSIDALVTRQTPGGK
jgi:putative oxidoreductase